MTNFDGTTLFLHETTTYTTFIVLLIITYNVNSCKTNLKTYCSSKRRKKEKEERGERLYKKNELKWLFSVSLHWLMIIRTWFRYTLSAY